MSLADFDKYMDPEDDRECEVHVVPLPCWRCRQEADIEKAEGMKETYDDYRTA